MLRLPPVQRDDDQRALVLHTFEQLARPPLSSGHVSVATLARFHWPHQTPKRAHLAVKLQFHISLPHACKQAFMKGLESDLQRQQCCRYFGVQVQAALLPPRKCTTWM